MKKNIGIVICLLSMHVHGIADIWRGARAYRSGDVDKAQQMFEHAFIADQTDAVAAYDLAKIAYKKQQYAQAEAYSSKAAQYAQNVQLQIQAYFDTGNAQVQQKKLKEALANYKEVIARDQHHEEAKKMIEQIEKLLEEQEKQQQQQKNQQQDQNNSQNQQDQQNQQQSQNNQKSDQQQDGSDGDGKQDQQNGNNQGEQQGNQEKQNQQGQQGEQENAQNDMNESPSKHDGSDMRNKGNELGDQKAEQPREQQKNNQQKNQQQKPEGDKRDSHEKLGNQDAGNKQGNAQQGHDSPTSDMHPGSFSQDKQAPQKEQGPEDLLMALLEDKDAQMVKEMLKAHVKQQMPRTHGQKNW